MGILEKLTDKILELPDKVEVRTQINSIAAEAAKSTYYFPVLCSKNIDQKNAMMIVTNLEAAYASFLQACFSMMPGISVKKDSTANVDDVLKRFHQNIGVSSKNSLYLSLKEAFEEYKLFPNESLNEASDNIINILDRARKGMKHGNDRLGVDSDTIGKSKNKSVYSSNLNTQWNASIIDKKNEFRPTVVMAEIKFVYGGGVGTIDKVKIPIGVKAVMHPVDPDALTEKVMDSVAGKGILHNLIRYTTGEMLSLTDIIFGVKNMKKNISGNTDLDKWSDALDHRKRLNSISKAAFTKKAFLPNVSIVMSMEEINEIQRVIGYNLLTDTRRTVKFMEDNFLLSFVIADDLTETLYVMYDGHSKFEEYPYSSIRKENQKNEKLVNALIKATGAMIR